jgi:hypothetical protein
MSVFHASSQFTFRALEESAGIRRTPKRFPSYESASFLAKPLDCAVFPRFVLVPAGKRRNALSKRFASHESASYLAKPLDCAVFPRFVLVPAESGGMRSPNASRVMKAHPAWRSLWTARYSRALSHPCWRAAE